jgi:uncharacterized protein (TIGR02266 family)
MKNKSDVKTKVRKNKKFHISNDLNERIKLKNIHKSSRNSKIIKEDKREDKGMVERRKEKRAVVELEVRYSSQESFAVEWITNISKGGLFIKSENPLPPGTPLKITFSVPGKDIPVQLEGVVRWSAPPSSPSVVPGMGIEIVKIDEKSKKILDSFVDEILSSRRI